MKRLLALLLAGSLAASPVCAANLTPDQLTAAVSANNTDLFLLYPAGGPMKSLQWSVVKSLMITALGSSYLQAINNLSDVTSVTTARLNLGLGSAAAANAGVSGHALPFLDGTNAWSGVNTFSAGPVIDGAAGSPKFLNYTTGGVERWGLLSNSTTEGGGNAGSDFNIKAYSDAGSLLFTPLTITRSTGLVSIANSLTLTAGVLTAPQYAVNGAAGTSRVYNFNTAGSPRWQFAANATAEGGANAGSDFGLTRYNDAGSVIDTPIFVNRSTGLVSLADGLTVTGALTATLTGNVTGNVTGSISGGTVAGTSASISGNISGGSYTGLPVASTAAAGISAYATGAQVVTGTDTTHAATPASLTSQMSNALPGYFTVPGGIIEEYGSNAINANTCTTVSIPLTLPTGIYTIVASLIDNATVSGAATAASFSTSQITLCNNAGTTLSVGWVVVGH